MLLNKTTIVAVLVAMLAISALIWNWYHPKERIVEYTKETFIPVEVERIKEVRIPVKEVVVLEKKKAEAFLEDNDVKASLSNDTEITAIGEIEPSESGTIIIATMDPGTGKTELVQHTQPRSFASFENQKEIGIRYGMGTEGQAYELYGRWTFARVMSSYLALYGELNNRPEGTIMLELSYRW